MRLPKPPVKAIPFRYGTPVEPKPYALAITSRKRIFDLINGFEIEQEQYFCEFSFMIEFKTLFITLAGYKEEAQVAGNEILLKKIEAFYRRAKSWAPVEDIPLAI